MPGHRVVSEAGRRHVEGLENWALQCRRFHVVNVPQYAHVPEPRVIALLRPMRLGRGSWCPFKGGKSVNLLWDDESVAGNTYVT